MLNDFLKCHECSDSAQVLMSFECYCPSMPLWKGHEFASEHLASYTLKNICICRGSQHKAPGSIKVENDVFIRSQNLEKYSPKLDYISSVKNVILKPFLKK